MPWKGYNKTDERLRFITRKLGRVKIAELRREFAEFDVDSAVKDLFVRVVDTISPGMLNV
jgi:hypothetical protein